MAIAGAVVVAVKKELEERLKERLNLLKEVDVQEVGEKGIAVVLEAENTGRLKEVSEEINRWDEVLDFQLVYLNWEEVK